MIPEEKAKELFDKYEYFVRMYNDDTPRKDMQKECALIAVNLVLSVPYLLKYENWFYKEVKKEIEKL